MANVYGFDSAKKIVEVCGMNDNTICEFTISFPQVF